MQGNKTGKQQGNKTGRNKRNKTGKNQGQKEQEEKSDEEEPYPEFDLIQGQIMENSEYPESDLEIEIDDPNDSDYVP